MKKTHFKRLLALLLAVAALFLVSCTLPWEEGDAADPEKAVYWFGLAADGSAAYDFDTFAAFAGAPVFNGKSLEEIWDRVVLHSVDGCDPDEHPGWSM